MSATNLVIVLAAVALTVIYAMLTSRAAPVIARFVGHLFERRRHVHTLGCGH